MRNYDFTHCITHHLIIPLIILLTNFVPMTYCIAQGEYIYKSTEIKQVSWENDSMVLHWAADVSGDNYTDVIVTGGTFPPTPVRAVEMKILIISAHPDGNYLGWDSDYTVLPRYDTPEKREKHAKDERERRARLRVKDPLAYKEKQRLEYYKYQEYIEWL